MYLRYKRGEVDPERVKNLVEIFHRICDGLDYLTVTSACETILGEIVGNTAVVKADAEDGAEAIKSDIKTHAIRVMHCRQAEEHNCDGIA